MLYIEDPTVESSLEIPLAAGVDADGGDIILTLTDDMREVVYSGALSPDAVTDYSLTATAIWGVDEGQYTYALTQDGDILSAGVLQVGLTGAEYKQYTHTRTIKTYERD